MEKSQLKVLALFSGVKVTDEQLEEIAAKFETIEEFQTCGTKLHEATKFDFSQTESKQDMLTTEEVADILDVSTSTVKNWRTRTLFGCPFFTADLQRGNTWYYERERVEQLKSVYQKGILQSMNKLARRFQCASLSANFQKSDSNEGHLPDTLSGNFQKSDSSSDYFQKCGTSEGHCLKDISPTFYPADEVAEILGINEKTLDRWRASKIFLSDMIDHEGTHWYSAEKVNAKKFAQLYPFPDVTDADIAEVGALTYAARQDLKTQINQYDLRNYFPLDRQGKGIVCPICGNGSGNTGDGVTASRVESANSWYYLHHCFKGGDFEGKLTDILSKIYSDYNRVLAVGKKMLAKSVDTPLPPVPVRADYADDEKAIFRADILKAQEHLNELPAEDRRGLSLDTYRHFGCGYLESWTHPNHRGKKSAVVSRRLIIPTSEYSYNAIMPKRDRTAENQKWKSMKAGTANLFNGEGISAGKSVIIVEGEIDAMSIWQEVGANVVATGSATNYNTLYKYLEEKAAAQKNEYLFIVLMDNDEAGRKSANNITGRLKKMGYPALSYFLSEEEKKDANDMLQEGGLKTRLEDIMLDAEMRKIDLQVEEVRPRPTTQQVMSNCPIDLHVPANFIFSNVGIIKGDDLICNTPLVVTKKFRDVDSDEYYTELAYFDHYTKSWRCKFFADDVLSDHRCIGKSLNRVGISFTQKNAAKLAEYLVALPYIPQNLSKIPCERLYNRTGWVNGKFQQFIYPDHLPNSDVLNDPKGIYKDKFKSKGDYNRWKESVKYLFSRDDASPAFMIIFGAALLAPLVRLFGLRNSQYLLWCASGKGKSAVAKIAMSIYGDPERLKNTFNGTSKAIADLPKNYNDLPVWMDEFQSASKNLREDIPSIVYSYAEHETRNRLARSGESTPTAEYLGTRIITAEQPILNEHTDAGAYNRLLSISSDRLFPNDDSLKISDIHRFFSNNYGFFGIEWIGYIKDNLKVLQESFKKSRQYFEDVAQACNWTNGWSDNIAGIHTALQCALPLIDATFTAESVHKIFIRDFHEVIGEDIPKATTYGNQQRALKMLQDYVNSHPKYFKRQVFTNDGDKWYSCSDGSAQVLQGYIFQSGEVRFIPTALNTILQNDLGFSSAKAILQAWQAEGILKEANNGYAFARRERLAGLGNMMLVCFKENTLLLGEALLAQN